MGLAYGVALWGVRADGDVAITEPDPGVRADGDVASAEPDLARAELKDTLAAKAAADLDFERAMELRQGPHSQTWGVCSLYVPEAARRLPV